MLKTLLVSVVLTLIAGCNQCQDESPDLWNFDNSPWRVFDMRNNITNKTRLEISYVKVSEIQAACDAQSRKFGFNGFPNGAQACSWVEQHRCVMILPEKVDMRTAGHEFLHCLQGNWHPE
jgi:ferredoxin